MKETLATIYSTTLTVFFHFYKIIIAGHSGNSISIIHRVILKIRLKDLALGRIWLNKKSIFIFCPYLNFREQAPLISCHI
jgi:hypothetical protein